MEEISKKDIYKKLEDAYKQIEDCLDLLKKQEENLHKEVLTAIDQEKMEKIINRINKIN